jgi:hypothetical protein
MALKMKTIRFFKIPEASRYNTTSQKTRSSVNYHVHYMQHVAFQTSVYRMLITGRTTTVVSVNWNIEHCNPQQRILDKINCKPIPLQALKVPGIWGSQISRQSAYKGGKVVSLKHRPLLPLYCDSVTVPFISGSWFRASTITTLNKVQRDAPVFKSF